MKIRHVNGLVALCRDPHSGVARVRRVCVRARQQRRAYDPFVVVGLFTYLDDTHEIDIELSRWRVASDPAGQYVVQPGERPGNKHRFRLDLAGD